MRHKTELGVIGLGNIGGGLALQALEKSFRVVGYTLGGAKEELLEAGLVEIRKPGEFRQQLPSPRIVLLYVPAGKAVDQLLSDLQEALEPGDIIADGGNSYWGESIRRHERLAAQGLHFVDLGTSGGISGARHGACFMAGGEKQAVEMVEPILRQLAVPNGYAHAGPPGAGHFAKLVHNGIEFGMLQAIGEGVDLLSRFHQPLDIAAVLKCWRNGSVIRSWLVELMEEAYRTSGGLTSVPSFVEDTGEVNWLVADALRMEVPVPVIAQAVMQLFASRDDRKNWAKAIAMMRHGFGGHPFGPAKAIADERQKGRIGDWQGEEMSP